MANIQQPSDPVYLAVMKAISKQQCPSHSSRYQYYYQKKLLCQLCFYEAMYNEQRGIGGQTRKDSLYNLKSIFDNPIRVMLYETTLQDLPDDLEQLVMDGYMQRHKKGCKDKVDETTQKETLRIVLDGIKQKVSEFCDSVMERYTQMVNENIEGQLGCRNEMQRISTSYRQQFYSLIEDQLQQGTKDELQNLLAIYQEKNQNPADKIAENLDKFMRATEGMPYVEWGRLKEIQDCIDALVKQSPNTLITAMVDKVVKKLKNKDQVEALRQKVSSMANEVDVIRCQDEYSIHQRLFKADSSDSQIKMTHSLILPNTVTRISHSDYEISYSADQITIKNPTSLKVHSIALSIDSLYQIAVDLLLGVSYSKLTLIGISDGNLAVLSQFDVVGCTDLLAFRSCLIVEACSKLFRIDLQDYSCQLIETDCSCLSYSLTESGREQFTFKDSKGNIVNCSVSGH